MTYEPLPPVHDAAPLPEPTEDTPPRTRRTDVRGNRVLALVVAAVVAVSALIATSQESGASRYDESVDSAVADIQLYWAATMPAVYHRSYDPIASNRLFPYSATNPPPGCGTGGRTPYREVAGNAFYCSEGDFLAWDEQGLFPKLRREYGDLAPALVLAHEFGHAIQDRVHFDANATIYLEQQADCFAGSWAAHVAHDGRLAPADLDAALVGLLGLRDPSGIDGSEDGAHGNGFDRVRAFQDGFTGGASVCARYEDDPPPVTEAGYTSYADYASGGDLSLSDLVPVLTENLQGYWSEMADKKVAPKLVPMDGSASLSSACEGGDGGVLSNAVAYCPSTNTIVYDRAALQHAANAIGDFAAGVLLASEYSSAAQHAVGVPLGSSAARTAATCLTGAYAASIDGSSGSTSADDLSLSPGDLDEVVAMLVKPDRDGSARGTAFDRVAAFRTGFFKGVSACTK